MTSLLADDHRPAPLTDVVTWVRNNEGNPDSGTPETWVVGYLNAHGLPARMTGGDQEIDAALNRRHRLIWLVWSDGRGNINGSRHSSHYVVVWGHGGGNVHLMNSLGDPTFGRNHAIPEGVFFANSQGWGIEVTRPVAADDGAAPPPPEDTDDMHDAQHIASHVKMTYYLAAIAESVQTKKPINETAAWADAQDQKGFNDQVNGALNNNPNIHDVTNNILQGVAPDVHP